MIRQLLSTMALVACLAAAVLAGDPPPRVMTLDPPSGTWIVDQAGLTAITIGFDEDVTVPPTAITVRDASQTEVTNYTAGYDALAHVLTLTFDDTVEDARLTVILDYAITDLAGQALDGEMPAPAEATLPSGDGQVGGQAVFRYTVLQGDINRDGTIDESDGDQLVGGLGRCQFESNYDAEADLNADGCLNVLDAAIYLLGDGALPAMDGVAPGMAQVTPGPGTSEVTVGFTEALAPAGFDARSMFLLDDTQNLVAPAAAQLAPDGLSATYDFGFDLTPCAEYAVNISNALSDGTGTLLTRPNTPPNVGAIPTTPSLDGHDLVTAATMVTLSGNTVDDATVEIEGPEGTIVTTAIGSSFSVDVPLAENQINHFFVTTISPCDGSRSGPAPTAVTQDGAPPAVFIDYPPDGVELTTPTTDVAGRVGDVLSGFMGLTVTVNGVPAIVDVGQGTNGTFIAHDVPLNLDDTTALQVTATDALGNANQEGISVVQATIPAGVPSMSILAGEGGLGEIETQLGEPLVVEVLDADGAAYANKLVMFHITRSNGTLALNAEDVGSTTIQLFTDDFGQAEVLWRLGSDAGCGNNRVEVTAASVEGTVVFTASATPGPAAQINVGTGNNQLGETGTPAPQPLDVWVSDGCNGIAGVPVEFSVVQGGGAIDGGNVATVVTSETGHATVDFDFGFDAGNQVVEANFPGNDTLPARFTLFGLVRDEEQPTSLSAVVLDNANQAIGGAESYLYIGDTTLGPVFSDADGIVTFDNIPTSGAARLAVDGKTALQLGGVPIAPGSFPSLAYELLVVPNATNGIGMPVLLPPLLPENAVEFDNTQDVELTVAGMPGLKLLVKAGSMTRANGTVPAPGDPAVLSYNQVHFNEVPMPPPDGAAPFFVGTMQPSGSVFDPPVEVRYPNLTGLPAGSITYFYSFDHDTNSFEIVSTGRVSEDGACIQTDPGSGLTKAGWSCNCPPYAVTGSVKANPNQLFDETWYLMINGQVVRANPDGSFCIDNVAAPDLDADFVGDDFHSLVGYSTVDGQTQWCYTEPFQIVQGVTILETAPTFSSGGIVINFPPVGDPPPLPVTMALITVDAEIEVGDATALVLTGTAIDGSDIPLTLDPATTYFSSNSAIATVQGGMVTAVGTLNGAPASAVTITAVHDGITATAEVIVNDGSAETTILGRVMMAGAPVDMADVVVSNATTRVDVETAADGTFSAGAFTDSDLVGLLTVVAEKDLAPDAGYAYHDNSQFPPLTPITDVGDLEMQAITPTAQVFVTREGAQAGAVVTDQHAITMAPGEVARLFVWVHDNRPAATNLDSYQLLLEQVAEPGVSATGSVTYVDAEAGPNAGDSILLDSQRADWVFEDQVVALSPIYNEALGHFGLYYSTIVGFFTTPAVVGGVHYLCEFELVASQDACGEFTLEFATTAPLPALFQPAGLDFGSSFANLTITVDGPCP